ncbi:MAG: hypothetical protein L0H70_02255 [Xanthomonadales bacterium]|nr:hypothetical protein [Xanthomonadales bacterium]
MASIETQFNEFFSEFGIRLPKDDVLKRKPGRIAESACHIQYLFGADELGAYLDLYATNRFTNPMHMRLRSGQPIENLSTPQESRVVSKNSIEDKMLQAEYFARNRKIDELLRAKGFIPFDEW